MNPNFAINLIAEVPPKPCKERVVYCDGGGGPLGHPKVYINLVGFALNSLLIAVCKFCFSCRTSLEITLVVIVD